DYVMNHYISRLERAFAQAEPEFVSLDIQVAPSMLETKGKSTAPLAKSTPAPTQSEIPIKPAPLLWDRIPDPTQSFSTFVVGPANEFAYKVAQRIAVHDEDYDLGLIFVHGARGYGKTHLLNAIAIEAHRTRKARVLSLRAEDFVRRFLGALRNSEELAFKEE